MDPCRTSKTSAWLVAERESASASASVSTRLSARHCTLRKKRRGELLVEIYEEERAEQAAVNGDPQHVDSESDARSPYLLDESGVEECLPQLEANSESESQLGSSSEPELSGHAPVPASVPGLNPVPTQLGSGRFTDHQRDTIRTLICNNLDRRPCAEEVESVAKATGLTINQAQNWIDAFYQDFPNPTLEQAMAWRSENTWYRDILNEWLTTHSDFYPGQEEKQRLADETGRTLQQVNSWFNYSRYKNGLTGNRFSPFQIAMLSASFEEDDYPSAGDMERLASEIELIFKQVDSWFRERRELQGEASKASFRDERAPLYEWLCANMENPYPSAAKKKELADTAGLTLPQLGKWFKSQRATIKRNKEKQRA